jgi:hypothetical protein
MWIETSAEVYAVIMAKHKKEMSVFSSYTDTTGTCHLWSNGHPEMMTEWGFNKSDKPLLKAESTKEHESDKDWTTNYFINCVQSDND